MPVRRQSRITALEKSVTANPCNAIFVSASLMKTCVAALCTMMAEAPQSTIWQSTKTGFACHPVTAMAGARVNPLNVHSLTNPVDDFNCTPFCYPSEKTQCSISISHLCAYSAAAVTCFRKTQRRMKRLDSPLPESLDVGFQRSNR